MIDAYLGTVLMRVSAYHTDAPEYAAQHRDVHHDRADCGYGQIISDLHRLSGSGGKPRCLECIRLS